MGAKKITSVEESRDDLLQCLKNVVIWLEASLEGSLEDADRATAAGDLSDAYQAIAEVWPREYLFTVIHEKHGPMFKSVWEVFVNDALLAGDLANAVKPYNTTMMWGKPNINGTRQTALAILLSEGYDELESLQAHYAFARDVIGRVTIEKDSTLSSETIKKWMDDFEISSSETTSETEFTEDGNV